MERMNVGPLFAAGAMVIAVLALIVALGGLASAGGGGQGIVVRSKSVPGATNQTQGNGVYDFVRATQKCKADEVPLSANASFSQPAISPTGQYRADVNTIERFSDGYLAFGATDYDINQGNVHFKLQVVCKQS